MSVLKINGRPLVGLMRQTGDTIEQQEDGTWLARVRYLCQWSQALYLAPQRNSARHPDFSALVCNGCSIARLKPGVVAELNASYKGLIGPETPPNPETDPLGNSTEEVISGTSEAPIETHKDFNTLIGGTKAAPLNGAIFDDNEKFLGFKGDSDYAGVDSYLIPSTIYRKSTPSRARPSSLADVGTRRSPGLSAPLGGDWLFTARTWQRDGAVYNVTEEYQASGPAGWDTIIYPA